jgi:ERCC4-type nuclease
MTDADNIPTLPALKGLGRLADVRPMIVIDTRGQQPLMFTRLAAIRGTLTSGDYSFAGGEHVFAVERKVLDDLTGCCTAERERFERELHRLRGFRFARLLIVGTPDQVQRHEYTSNVSPRAVLHSLAAWEARFIPVAFAPTPAAAARQVETWAYWVAREIVEAANWLLRGQRHNTPAAGTEETTP